MGFDSNGIRFLLYARKRGVDFHSTATVGRQYTLTGAADIRRAFVTAGATSEDVSSIQNLLDEHKGFSEGILQLLGAERIESFDASGFEGATHIHDLNLPIGEKFREAYTVVIDGGTLEHIFNYPAALRNCMEMVAEGGHFVAITPTNNFPGHGFYQFSSELFFRALSSENGYEIIDLIFMEDYVDAPWYRMLDAARLGGRVTFQNSRPGYLLVIAKRTSIKPIFERFPQQSDYSAAWGGRGPEVEKVPRLLTRIPRGLLRRLRRIISPNSIRFNDHDLTRFDPF